MTEPKSINTSASTSTSNLSPSTSPDPSPYSQSRRSTSASRVAPHGRGGAGNVAAPPPPPSPTDLQTPTLKEDVYTTGRGGSGNMAKNVGKEGARRAQDVVALPRRDAEGTHVGRGGAANIVKVPTRDAEAEGGEAVGKLKGKEAERKGKGRTEEGANPNAIASADEGIVERGRRWVNGLVGRGGS